MTRGDAGRRWAGRWSLAAIGLATFTLHALIAWRFPLPGTFRKYGLAAQQLASGELPPERLVDFSPFYLYLSLAAERWLPRPEAALVGLQMVLAAASVALVFRLLEGRVATWVAAAAAAVMAFDRHLLVYERILEPEICLIFCLLAFLACLEARHDLRWRQVGGALLAGVFAALCLAIRPTFLPAFLLVPAYTRLRGDRGRVWLYGSLAFAAPLAAMLLLSAWRAAAVTGDARTPVMNPGTVFFEGNNPLSWGTSAIYPPVVLGLVRHSGEIPDSAHVYYRTVARADAGRELSIAEVNAFWSARAVRFIRDEPGRSVRLLGAKLVRAFHGFRWHDVPLAWKLDGVLAFVPALPFAVLSALALIGTLFEVGRWRESLLYYALGMSQLAVMLAFYVSARQRLVLFPALLYFAAVAVERLVRRRGRSWPWLLLTGLLAVSLSLPDDPIADEIYRRGAWRDAEQRIAEVRAKSREQPLALHAEAAVAAVAAAPWWLDWLRPAYFPQDRGSLEERVAALLASRPRASAAADFDLAAVHLQAGQVTAARRLLEPLAEQGRAVYRGGQQPSDPLFLLGRAAALAGDRADGVAYLERALERSPGNPFVLAELVTLTGDPAYQELLGRYWSDLDAQYFLGRALFAHGRYPDAVQALGFVVRRLPGLRDARVLLAAALGESGHLAEGARQYLEATRLRLEPILASRQIVALFRRWMAENPGSVEVQLFGAQVLHQHGHFAEALAVLEGLEPPAALAAAVDDEAERIRRALGEAKAETPQTLASSPMRAE